MEIIQINKAQVSKCLTRYYFQMEKRFFLDFGFIIESVEGIGSHRESREYENCMEIDVPVYLESDFLYCINALQNWKRS